MESEPVKAAIARADENLSGRGRVLVRASGTEPLIRVMVEAPTQEETDRSARSSHVWSKPPWRPSDPTPAQESSHPPGK